MGWFYYFDVRIHTPRRKKKSANFCLSSHSLLHQARSGKMLNNLLVICFRINVWEKDCHRLQFFVFCVYWAAVDNSTSALLTPFRSCFNATLFFFITPLFFVLCRVSNNHRLNRLFHLFLATSVMFESICEVPVNLNLETRMPPCIPVRRNR